jgi:uncharacterized lipoprotein
MKLLAAPTSALLLVFLLSGCSHSPSDSAKAAAAARQQARAQARAAVAAENQDRQQLESVPLPSKNVYMSIHTRQSWVNPFLIVSKSTVNLSML